MEEKLSELYKYFSFYWNEIDYILPPNPNLLNGFIPELNQLSRDNLNIVGQLQNDNITVDGGDSAHRTGVLAFCNSQIDSQNLRLFENEGIMVRHPTQVPANNWKNCSRDQLIGYISGCWRTNQYEIAERLLEKHLTRIPPYTCQNTEADFDGTLKFPPIGDPLAPHDLMFFKICAGDNNASKDQFGQFSLHVAIEVMGKDITTEKNQLLMQSIICGRLNLFVKVHPNYKESLLDYWAGWRKQEQIANALIKVVELELERYRDVLSPPIFFR